jgi:hypothetical protein
MTLGAWHARPIGAQSHTQWLVFKLTEGTML